MTPEQIGFIVGIVLFAVAIPLLILLIGYRASRNQEPETRATTRRRVGIAAGVVFAGLAAIGGLTFLSGVGGGSSIAQIRAGMTRGCTSRCVERTKNADACQRMCVCVTDRFIKEVGEKRLTAMNSPKDLTSQDRAKLIAAALHCRRLLPPATK